MIRVAILTISDSAVAGTREDRSGPAVAEKAQSLGWSIVAREVLKDEREEIAAAMTRLIDQGQLPMWLSPQAARAWARAT